VRGGVARHEDGEGGRGMVAARSGVMMRGTRVVKIRVRWFKTQSR